MRDGQSARGSRRFPRFGGQLTDPRRHTVRPATRGKLVSVLDRFRPLDASDRASALATRRAPVRNRQSACLRFQVISRSNSSAMGAQDKRLARSRSAMRRRPGGCPRCARATSRGWASPQRFQARRGHDGRCLAQGLSGGSRVGERPGHRVHRWLCPFRSRSRRSTSPRRR
jgi:hypothetical protein